MERNYDLPSKFKSQRNLVRQKYNRDLYIYKVSAKGNKIVCQQVL